MDVPGQLRGFNKSQLIVHAQQVFKTPINGTKNEMLASLKTMYDNKVDDGTEVPVEPEDKSILTEIQSAAASAARGEGIGVEEEEFEAPTVEVLPEMIDQTPNPMTSQLAQPEVVKMDGFQIHKWPSTVQWLYNPATKLRYEATPRLLERLDLVPCAAPAPEA